ncbi:hypothetical protein V5F32_20095 [Xanthobacter oligotrophicus]|uniref:Uncharacterized protein n=1 Tax=Xanthobacter oligotrophicus TaxID=2607286 RepID=A0ABW7A3B5_9HYPH
MTRHTLPGWVPFHDEQPRGLAYETAKHFVHFFGKDSQLWIVSPGLTVTEKRTTTLRDWIERTFGAEDVVDLRQEVAHTVRGVWRPGLLLQDEIHIGLDTNSQKARAAEQAMLILLQRLDEIFLFIEPSLRNLDTFGHKTRELLILASTEVENSFVDFIKISGPPTYPKRQLTTNDYVKLLDPLHLSDYQVSFLQYENIPAIRPFEHWSSTNPAKSLSWYDAYNKTKHNREMNFDKSTVLNCIQAISANLILFSVRHGPISLFNGGTTLSGLINQIVRIDLINPDPSTFYIPKIKIVEGHRDDLICFGSEKCLEPRSVQPLTL